MTTLYSKSAEIEKELQPLPHAGTCKTCIYVCDRTDEKPPLSSWCGNDQSKNYALNVRDFDVCEEYKGDNT